MFGLSPQELLIVLLIILLLFGAKKIPELARGMGKGMREFKKGLNDVNDEIEKAAAEPAADAPGKTAGQEVATKASAAGEGEDSAASSGTDGADV